MPFPNFLHRNNSSRHFSAKGGTKITSNLRVWLQKRQTIRFIVCDQFSFSRSRSTIPWSWTSLTWNFVVAVLFTKFSGLPTYHQFNSYKRNYVRSTNFTLASRNSHPLATIHNYTQIIIQYVQKATRCFNSWPRNNFTKKRIFEYTGWFILEQLINVFLAHSVILFRFWILY